MIVEHALLPDGVAGGIRVEVDQGVIVSSMRPRILATSPASLSRASRTATATRSTAPCEGGHTVTGGTLLDLARADVRRRRPSSPRQLLRARTRHLRGDGAAGITAVGEFHYLHHQPDGTPYADPNEMGRALLAAAGEAGSGSGCSTRATSPPGSASRRRVCSVRFCDGDRRRGPSGSRPSTTPRVGAAIHSVRAVPREQLKVVVEASVGMPLHVHVSEQVAENDACLEATGSPRPSCWPKPMLSGRDHRRARHAPHRRRHPAARWSRTNVCFCPTTERDLADGIGPARQLHDAGAVLTLGSDSHAVIDMFEEMRAVEMHERLATQRARPLVGHRADGRRDVAGHRSLGFDDGGGIAPGKRADLVTVDLGEHRDPGAGATAEHHRLRRQRRRRATGGVLERRSTHLAATGRWSRDEPALTGIGELVTNDPGPRQQPSWAGRGRRRRARRADRRLGRPTHGGARRPTTRATSVAAP